MEAREKYVSVTIVVNVILPVDLKVWNDLEQVIIKNPIWTHGK